MLDVWFNLRQQVYNFLFGGYLFCFAKEKLRPLVDETWVSKGFLFGMDWLFRSVSQRPQWQRQQHPCMIFFIYPCPVIIPGSPFVCKKKIDILMLWKQNSSPGQLKNHIFRSCSHTSNIAWLSNRNSSYIASATWIYMDKSLGMTDMETRMLCKLE